MALYKGQGGATFEVTPPREGTQQRERFDAQLEAGELVLVDDAPMPAPTVTEPVEAEKPKRRTSKAAAAAED